MRKNIHRRVKDSWFEIGHMRDPTTGQRGRCYTVQCHRCPQKVSYHATGMSNEALRKIFIRAKWEIGKTRHQHLCPDCAMRENKPAPPAAVVSPPAPAPAPAAAVPVTAAMLKALWDMAEIAERIEFWTMLNDLDPPPIARSVQLIEPDTVAAADADARSDQPDTTGADWWEDLMKQPGAAA